MAETIAASIEVPVKAPYRSGSAVWNCYSGGLFLRDTVGGDGYRPSASYPVGSLATYEGIPCTGLTNGATFARLFFNAYWPREGVGDWAPAWDTLPLDSGNPNNPDGQVQWFNSTATRTRLWVTAADLAQAHLESNPNQQWEGMRCLYVWDIAVFAVAGETGYRYGVIHSIDLIEGDLVVKYVYSDGSAGYVALVDGTHTLVGVFSAWVVVVHGGSYDEITGSWSEFPSYGGRPTPEIHAFFDIKHDVEMVDASVPSWAAVPADQRGLWQDGLNLAGPNAIHTTAPLDPPQLVVPRSGSTVEATVKLERVDTADGHVTHRSYVNGTMTGEHVTSAFLVDPSSQPPPSFEYAEAHQILPSAQGAESWRLGTVVCTMRGRRSTRNWTRWRDWWTNYPYVSVPGLGYVVWNIWAAGVGVEGGYPRTSGDVFCELSPYALPKLWPDYPNPSWVNPHPATYWQYPQDYMMPRVDEAGYVYWVNEVAWGAWLTGVGWSIQSTGVAFLARLVHAVCDRAGRTKEVSVGADGGLYHRVIEDVTDAASYGIAVRIGTSTTASNPVIVSFSEIGHLGVWFMDGDTQAAAYSTDDGATWTLREGDMLGSNLTNFYAVQDGNITYGVGVRDSTLYFARSNDEGATQENLPGALTEVEIGACADAAIPCLIVYPGGRVVAWATDDNDAILRFVSNDHGFRNWSAA